MTSPMPDLVNQIVTGYRVTYTFNGGTRTVADVKLPYIELAAVTGVLSLTVTRDDGLQVTIANPGAYGGPREGGTGLDTVRKRLALAYGARATSTVTLSPRLTSLPG